MKRISLWFISITASFVIYISPKTTTDQLFNAIKNATQNPNAQNITTLEEALSDKDVNVNNTYKPKYLPETTPLVYALNLAITTGTYDPFKILLDRSNPEAKVMGELTLLQAAKAEVRYASTEKKCNAERVLALIATFQESKNKPYRKTI